MLGVPQEDARFVLPNAMQTQLICTMNARALMNFFRLRCCTRAQWEIRELANQMREVASMVAPVLFAHSGPSCETDGICWEGKQSCERAMQVRGRG